VVGLYKLNPVDPELESAWYQPLSLSSEKLVLKVCFQIQVLTSTVWQVHDAQLRLSLDAWWDPPGAR
jgi:hypothetical protein